MLVNRQNLAELFQGFNTIFNSAFSEGETFYQNVAMEVPSVSSDETYGWLGQLPSMREWIGERQIQNLMAHSYNIKNKNFELTIAVNRNDIEDDRIGVYKPVVQDLAINAKTFPDRLVFELLAKSFTEKCFDGKPMVSDSHEITINNKAVIASNKMTKELSYDSYAEARAQMMSIKGNDGKSLRIVPDVLCVSPQKETLAKKITMLDMVDGTTNIHKGTANVVVVPELIDTPDYWFLLCTNRPIRPLIYQNRRPAKLVSKVNETDDNTFFDNQYIYGVDSRCNAGFGLWQLILGSTGAVKEQATE